MNRFRKISLLSVLLFATYTTNAQHLADSTAVKVDRLFSKWEGNDRPGCVVGIIRDGQPLYTKGFGLAQLENKSQNTPESIYYMCSVSKQFTGYTIALLVNEGKIKLDADIHIYLPWLPHFDQRPITVRNLLHHTSGIRDDIMLARFYGLGAEGILTQQAALKMIARQRTLNFKPGEKFSYSNSNYVLLAAIVERISGKSFKDFTDSVIFKPLNMNSSKFVDDYTTLIPKKANSYSMEQDGYHNAPQNVYTLGDGGLFTNATDLLKWISVFYSTDSLRAKAVELMVKPGKLNNGKALNYAMGINVNNDKGVRYFTHNGGLAGYRTIMAVYPAQRTGFLIFGNGGDGEVYNKLTELSEIFIPKPAIKDSQPISTGTPSERIFSDTSQLAKFAGTYVAKNGYQVLITKKNGGLYLNGNQALLADTAASFYLKARPAVKYRFNMDRQTKTINALLSSPILQNPITLEKIGSQHNEPKRLKEYCGRYYCGELDYYFDVLWKDNALWINDKNNNQAKLTLSGKQHLFTAIDYMAHFNVERGRRGEIAGLELNSGEVSGLIFKKVGVISK